MKLSDFHYDLPPELIAQTPSARRGGSRLLHVPVTGPRTITPFEAILDRFRGDEVLVLNDTKVVPARLRGHKASGGEVELLFVEPCPEGIVALTRGTRLKPGTPITLPGGATATFLERLDDGAAKLSLEGVVDLWAWLEAHGALPLPPYIEREAGPEDRGRYQTVFADKPGAVAAPTAGLHLTDAVLDALRAKGVAIHTVTLHVGPGTFAPVRVEDIATHHMHSERFEVPAATAAAVTSGRPVVAVGTTVVRALEAHARAPGEGRTDIFIYPGFEFRVVDGLLTNFHLPSSTLMMLVSAFAGHARVMAAYAHAVEARLQFFSYGDASLWAREGGRWT